MFSHELVTNPWMYYTFRLPPPFWFGLDERVWVSKKIRYNPLGIHYSGWFPALLMTDDISAEIKKVLISDFKRTMGMGTHPRLGEASIFMKLAGVPEVLSMISRQF
jgi:hypothetical protein